MAIPNLKLKFETTGTQEASKAFVEIRKETTETEKSLNKANIEMTRILENITHLEKQTFKSTDGRVRTLDGRFSSLADEVQRVQEEIGNLEKKDTITDTQLNQIDSYKEKLQDLDTTAEAATETTSRFGSALQSISNISGIAADSFYLLKTAYDFLLDEEKIKKLQRTATVLAFIADIKGFDRTASGIRNVADAIGGMSSFAIGLTDPLKMVRNFFGALGTGAEFIASLPGKISSLIFTLNNLYISFHNLKDGYQKMIEYVSNEENITKLKKTLKFLALILDLKGFHGTADMLRSVADQVEKINDLNIKGTTDSLKMAYEFYSFSLDALDTLGESVKVAGLAWFGWMASQMKVRDSFVDLLKAVNTFGKEASKDFSNAFSKIKISFDKRTMEQSVKEASSAFSSISQNAKNSYMNMTAPKVNFKSVESAMTFDNTKKSIADIMISIEKLKTNIYDSSIRFTSVQDSTRIAFSNMSSYAKAFGNEIAKSNKGILEFGNSTVAMYKSTSNASEFFTNSIKQSSNFIKLHATKNIIGMAEATSLFSVGLGYLGIGLLQTDSTLLKVIGTVGVLAAIFMGSFAALASYALKIVGDAFISLGEMLWDFSEKASETFKKTEKGLFTFQFIFKGIQKASNDAYGALEDWEALIDKISRFSTYSRADIQQGVAEALLLGKSIGLNTQQIKKMVNVSADLASITGDTLTDAVLAFGAGLQGASQATMKYGLHLNASGIMHSKYGKQLDGSFEKLSDQEKAQYRFAAALEQSVVIQGKASAQMETMAGIQQLLEKSYTDLMARFGETSYFTRLLKKSFAETIQVISQMNKDILTTIGGLIDFVAVILLVSGYIIKFTMTIAFIATMLGILKILYANLSLYILQSASAQAFLTGVSMRLGASLGFQAVAVTSLNAAFLNLGMTLKVLLVGQLKAMLAILMSIPKYIFLITRALLLSPLFWKITAIVGALYLMYKAFERIEKRTKIFETTFKAIKVALFGANDNMDKFNSKAKTFGKVISYLTDLMIVFVAAIVNGLETLIYIILAIVKTFIQLFDVIVPFTDIFGEWTDKIKGVQDALDNLHTTMAEEMFSAIDRLGMGWNAYGDELDDISQESENFIDINKKLADSFENIDKAMIDARINGNKYKEAQLGILKAQKELKDLGEDATSSDIKAKELEIYEKQAQFAFDIKDSLGKTIEENKGLQQSLVASQEAIKAIQDKANLSIELEINPIVKEIQDLKSLGALTGDQSNLVSQLEEKIKNIRLQKTKEATDQIESLQKEANQSYTDLVGSETEKIVDEYNKRAEGIDKSFKDGYLSQIKYKEMEEALTKERGDKIIGSIDYEKVKTKESLDEKLLLISDFYEKDLVNAEQYSLEYQKIKQMQLDLEIQMQKNHADTNMDIFSSFSEQSKKLIDDTFKNLKPQIDPNSLDNSLLNMQHITSKVSKEMSSSIINMAKEAGSKIQDLRAMGLIDENLQKKYLNKLEQMSKDSFKEVLNDLGKMIREYNSSIEKTFDMTQEEIEGMKFKEMIDKQLESAVYDFEVEIEATISGSEGLRQELEKMKDPNTYKYQIGADFESIDKSIEGFREKNDLGYNSDELKAYSKDLRETLQEHQKFQDELLIKTGSFLDNIKAGADNVVDQIFGKNLFSPTMRKAMAFEAQADFESSFMSWGSNIDRSFSKLGSSFSRGMSKSDQQAGAFLTYFKRTFIEFPSEILSTITSVLGPIGSGIKLAVTQMFSQQSWMAEVIKFFGKSRKEMSQFIAGMTDNVILLLQNVIENIPYFFTVLASKLPEVLVSIVKFLFGLEFWFAVFMGAWDAIAAFAISLNEEFKKVVNGFISGFKYEFEKMWQGLVFMAGALLAGYMTYALIQGTSNWMLSLAGIGGGIASIILMALNSEKVLKSLSDTFFYPFYSAWKKIWAFITGTEARIKKRLAEYKVDEKELIEAKKTEDNAISSYVGRYGDSEFRIKTSVEGDQGKELENYANLVDENLSDTALNFAEEISSNTQNNISNAIKLGLEYGYLQFEKENDFTIKVKFTNGEAVPTFASGGFVPGSAISAGDSLANDSVPALLSPGEFVLPRSITKNKALMDKILMLIGEEKGIQQFATGGSVDMQLMQILKQQKSRGYADAILAGGGGASSEAPPSQNVTITNDKAPQDEYETFDGGDGLAKIIGDALTDGFKVLLTLPEKLISGIGNALKSIDFGEIDFSGLEKGFTSAWDSVKNAFNIDLPSSQEMLDFFTKTIEALDKLLSKIGDIGKDLWKELNKGLTKALDFTKITSGLEGIFGKETGAKVSKGIGKIGATAAMGGIVGLMVAIVSMGVAAIYAGTVFVLTEGYMLAVSAAQALYNYALIAGQYIYASVTIAASACWAAMIFVGTYLWAAATAAWAFIAPFLIIGATIALFVGLLWVLYENWDLVVKSFKDAINFISSIGLPILNLLKIALVAMFNFIMLIAVPVLNALGIAFTYVWDVIKKIAAFLYSGFISSIVPFFQTFFSKILTYLIAGFSSYIVPFFSKAFSFLDPTKINWGSLGDKLFDVIKAAFNKITGGASSAVSGAKSVVKKVGSFLGFYDGGFVSGDAPYKGNNIRNDVVPAMLSPGEYVLSREITQNKSMMDMILSIIEGGNPQLAYEGLPRIDSPSFGKMENKKIEITMTENKNITIEVRADSKVSISGEDFKKTLLPAIKEALYSDSKKGKIILSERGIEK